MKKNRTVCFLIALQVVLLLLTAVLLFSAMGFKRDSPSADEVEYLTQMSVSVDGGQWQEITLPHVFESLSPRTPIVLRTVITPDADDGIYIQSKYAQADVYLDQKHVFTFGKQENYPGFMMTPADEIHVIETYGTGKPMEVQISYLSPATDREFYVPAPMVGTAKELILERSVSYGYSWSLSLAQILGGIALLMISMGVLFIDRKGVLFTWLGLFSLTTGLWFFGANSFAITVFANSAWLYLSAFLGFSLSIIPLLHFIRIAVDFTDPRPIRILEALFILGNLLSVVLQLLKIWPLHQSWAIFRIAVPAALVLITFLVLQEHIRWKNPYAARFVFPTVVLTVSAIVGSAQRLSRHTMIPPSLPFFQIGVILFLLMMGMIAGITVKNSVDLKKRERELSYEKEILSMQTEEQREASLLLAQNQQELSRQRHDLRHHLAVIQELSGDNAELQAYLTALTDKIPKAQERFCENNVVNAVIAHYAACCEQKGIILTARLVVSCTNNQTIDSNLCVIFANLLENAVEACDRMKDGSKYINLNSTEQNRLLTITMDNSFNGKAVRIGERFRSSKRNDYGIGLASVRSIAEAAHGDADFRAEGKEFRSSVYLHLS